MKSPFCPKPPKITTSQVDPGFIYPYGGKSIEKSYDTDYKQPQGYSLELGYGEKNSKYR